MIPKYIMEKVRNKTKISVENSFERSRRLKKEKNLTTNTEVANLTPYLHLPNVGTDAFVHSTPARIQQTITYRLVGLVTCHGCSL